MIVTPKLKKIILKKVAAYTLSNIPLTEEVIWLKIATEISVSKGGKFFFVSRF
jgi:hypothetical protein